MTTALTTTNCSRDYLVQFANSIVKNYAMCKKADDWKFIDEDAPAFYRDNLLFSFRHFRKSFEWMSLGWF